MAINPILSCWISQPGPVLICFGVAVVVVPCKFYSYTSAWNRGWGPILALKQKQKILTTQILNPTPSGWKSHLCPLGYVFERGWGKFDVGIKMDSNNNSLRANKETIKNSIYLCKSKTKKHVWLSNTKTDTIITISKWRLFWAIFAPNLAVCRWCNTQDYWKTSTLRAFTGRWTDRSTSGLVFKLGKMPQNFVPTGDMQSARVLIS